MSAAQLIALWPSKMAASINRVLHRRKLKSTQRDIDYISRTIAELQEARRYLQSELMHMKREAK